LDNVTLWPSPQATSTKKVVFPISTLRGEAWNF
jgi:hypothetical protein